MKLFAISALTTTLLATSFASAQDRPVTLPPETAAALSSVSPGLERYTQESVLGDLWQRPGLSPRDRSVVTVAALIARNITSEMPFHFDLALENGVEPAELSEIITHLAFYSGWANATAAVEVASEVFEARGIGEDQLPSASPELNPIEEEPEAVRAASVNENIRPVTEGLADFTDNLLFHDVWLRPDLEPRDRSLITVTSLVSLGQAEQIPYHLNRAMDNGLTQEEASEALTQLAFYAGWPNTFSAVPIFRGVFEERSN